MKKVLVRMAMILASLAAQANADECGTKEFAQKVYDQYCANGPTQEVIPKLLQIYHDGNVRFSYGAISMELLKKQQSLEAGVCKDEFEKLWSVPAKMETLYAFKEAVPLMYGYHFSMLTKDIAGRGVCEALKTTL